MKVLVVGATGALGFPTMETLVAAGHETTVFDADPNRAASIARTIPWQARILVFDLIGNVWRRRALALRHVVVVGPRRARVELGAQIVLILERLQERGDGRGRPADGRRPAAG